LVPRMYVSRLAYVWHVLLCVSVILFFFWMAGFEGTARRLSQSGFTQDTKDQSNSAQRGLKNGGPMSTETYNLPQALSKSLDQWQTKEHGEKSIRSDIKDAKESRMKEKKVKKYSWSKSGKSKQPSLFSLKDHEPGKLSKPVTFGLNIAKARLNYEFSDVKDAIRANTPQKRVPDFDSSKANIMDIVGNIPVGQDVPVESARQILIATTWRSGSTFLGDLLNHYKGTFYYFEPLHYYSTLKDLKVVQSEPDFLKSLYTCSFNSENSGFLTHVAKPPNKFLFENHNFRLWNSCKNLLPKNAMCFMPDYLSHVCPLFPIKLIKTVRLRVRKIEKLLSDPAMDLKVIVLVRDPRGVYNSRNTGPVKNWCKNDLCANPVTGCQDLNNDIQAAFSLESRYPGSVRLVRYEDLSMFPEETARSMLDFLDLPFTEGIAHYIETHTSKEKLKVVKNKKTKKIERHKDTYGTARNSTATAFAWRENLGFSETEKIQEACLVPMEKLGYKLVLNEEGMRSEDLPIEKTAEEVWPNV